MLAGMASGDDEAAALVRRFQLKVYGLSPLGIVRSPTLAEDVAQGAFVKAWRYAGAYDARVLRLSAKEIGTLEGIPVGIVKSRVRRGLMKLRDRLEVNDE